MAGSSEWHSRYEDAQAALGPGHQFHVTVRHGTMFAGLYAPRPTDGQSPHRQDEVYVVTRGSGTFLRGEERIRFGPGDLLFVPAGMTHRFEEFGEDFLCWAVFWGPDGGESTGR